MKSKKQSSSLQGTFTETIHKIAYRYGISQVFNDFLTMSMAAVTHNPVIQKSYYEDEYLETIAPYKDSELRHEFPKAFAQLITEMEDTHTSIYGNDVLGNFFEQHISNGRSGQLFVSLCLPLLV